MEKLANTYSRFFEYFKPVKSEHDRVKKGAEPYLRFGTKTLTMTERFETRLLDEQNLDQIMSMLQERTSEI